jgi:hypothetical protein
VVSPDLTRNDRRKQGPGGSPITNEGAGGEVYGTIFYLAESPHEAGTIWAGTDDGLVHLTRDGGKSWSEVTPKGLPEAQINAIEVSPHDKATAYVAVTRYKLNDFSPDVFRTTDYGRTWTRIVEGIPATTFVRVVREDTVRKGLLYAGTETGLYVSFDGGARWQPFQLNLPVVPITDLKVHGNDLVAATQGRAFWILDDLTVLRQLDDRTKTDVHLYTPSPALRVDGSGAGVPGLGRNPPNGAVIYYHLAKAPDAKTPVSVEILDQGGRVLRKLTSAETPAEASGPGPAPAARAAGRPTTKAGLNRVVWDLRATPVARVPGVFSQSPPVGPRVVPGRYQVRLTVGSVAQTASVEVRPDPRTSVAPDAWTAWQQLITAIQDRVNEMHGAVTELRDVREQVNALLPRVTGHAKAAGIEKAGKALVQRITAWEETILQPRQKTFQDVINFRNQLNEHYLFLGQALDGALPPVTDGMRERFTDLEARWADRAAELAAIRDREIPAFNALVKDSAVLPIVPKRPTAPTQGAQGEGAVRPGAGADSAERANASRTDHERTRGRSVRSGSPVPPSSM